MKEVIIYNLIKAIAPDLIERLLDKIKLYRGFEIKLPESTNQEELFLKIKKATEINKLWSINKENFSQSNFFYIIFINKNKKLINLNWPQITSVFYKEGDNQEKTLLILSQFTESQAAERGILTKNCNIVIEIMKSYFNEKNIDITKNIETSKILKDQIGNSFLNKNVFFWEKSK